MASPQHRVVTASAPGTLMLFGEHAVLHGHRALCAAVNRRLRVTATARPDDRVIIHSALGERSMALDALDASPPFSFVATCVAEGRSGLTGGVDLRIQSEFRDDLGLGSSAAVTVATLAALDGLSGRAVSAADLHRRGLAVIRHVQGVGSGTDVAASVLGGIVSYRFQPLALKRVASAMPLTVVYSGSKEKTAAVIARVDGLQRAQPEAVAGIYAAMDRVTGAAESAIAAGEWPQVGALMSMGQGLMEALGVCNARLREILQAMRDAPGILGAKISGSGLGDCLIGVGDAVGALPGERLDVAVSGEGVRLDGGDHD